MIDLKMSISIKLQYVVKTAIRSI